MLRLRLRKSAWKDKPNLDRSKGQWHDGRRRRRAAPKYSALHIASLLSWLSLLSAAYMPRTTASTFGEFSQIQSWPNQTRLCDFLPYRASQVFPKNAMGSPSTTAGKPSNNSKKRFHPFDNLKLSLKMHASGRHRRTSGLSDSCRSWGLGSVSQCGNIAKIHRLERLSLFVKRVDRSCVCLSSIPTYHS